MVSSIVIKRIAAEVGFDICGVTRSRHLAENEAFFRRWLDEGHSAGLDYLQHKTEKDAVLRLLEPLKQGTYPAEYTLVLIEDLLRQENVDDVLAFYRQRVQGMQNPQDQLNMDSLLPYFLEKATESQKAKFVEYMTDRAKNCDKRAARKYAVLLEVIKQGGYKG